MTAHGTPNQNNPAANSPEQAASPLLKGEVAASDSLSTKEGLASATAFEALFNEYAETMRNPQTKAWLSPQTAANTDTTNPVIANGSLNVAPGNLYDSPNNLINSTEQTAQLAYLQADDPYTPLDTLKTDENRLGLDRATDLRAAEQATNRGNLDLANRFTWAANDAGQASERVKSAEKRDEEKS
jgi:hypothetical protein